MSRKIWRPGAGSTQIGQLPADELEVFDLVYYQGLAQEEAARVLGISLRTLKRGWQAAMLRLHEELNRDREG